MSGLLAKRAETMATFVIALLALSCMSAMFSVPAVSPGNSVPRPAHTTLLNGSNVLNDPQKLSSLAIQPQANATGSFSLSVNPAIMSVRAPYSNYTYVNVADTGSSSVSVYVSFQIDLGPNLPPETGVVGYFYFNGPGGSGSTGLTVQTIVNSSNGTRVVVPAGTYNGTVTGTGNGQTETVSLQVIVQAAGPYFLVSASPSSLSISHGETNTVTVEVRSYNNYSGTVNLQPQIAPPSNGWLTIGITPWINLNANQTITTYMTIAAAVPGIGQGGNFTLSAVVSGAGWSDRSTTLVHLITPRPLYLYLLSSSGQLQPGRDVLLVDNFTNVGNIPVRMTDLWVASDFGTFPKTITPSLEVQPGQSRTFNFSITIPPNTLPGPHNVTATVNWQYYLGTQWYNASPGVIKGSLTVQPASPSLLPSGSDWRIIGIGLTTSLTLITVFLTLAYRASRRPQQSTPTTIHPPPCNHNFHFLRP